MKDRISSNAELSRSVNFKIIIRPIVSPTIIKLVVKSMTSQPWFTRTCYLSYNESSDWNNVHHLGTPRP